MLKVREKIEIVLVFVFLLTCVFFPGDPYHIKLVTYFLSMLFGADILFKNLTNKYYWPIYIMGAAFTTIAVVWSIALGNEVGQSVKQAYSMALLLLVIIIKELNINYNKWVIYMFMAMTVFFIVVALLDLTGIYVLDRWSFRPIMEQIESGYLRYNGQGIIRYRFFIKSAPVLIAVFCYSLYERKWIMSITCFIGLFLSGTRGNVFAGVIALGIACLLILHETLKTKKQRIIAAVILVAIVLVLLPVGINVLQGIMNSKQSASSDAIKYNQALGYIHDIMNPKTFFLGDGMGSYFTDWGRDMLVHETGELSFLDIYKKLGLILFIPYAVFICSPFAWKIDWGKKLGLFMYLLIAATNPFLYNSTGMIMFIYIYVSRPENTWFVNKLESKFGKAKS